MRPWSAELRQSAASQGVDFSLPQEPSTGPSTSAGAASGDGRSVGALLVADELGVSPDGETLSPLAAFLTHAALESGDNQAQAGQDAVQLMTVHAAKGLEFD